MSKAKADAKPKKKAKAKRRVRVVVSPLEPIDLGTAPDEGAVLSTAAETLTRFLFHKEFPENPSPTLLRFLALMTYTTDPQAPTLDDVAALPFFSTRVSPATLRMWASEDGWTARRAKTWETWHQRVVEASAAQYVKFRSDALTELGALRTGIVKALSTRLKKDEALTESKFHELVKALTALVRQESLLHEQANPRTLAPTGASGVGAAGAQAQTVIGELATPSSAAPAGGEMSIEEARLAAHAVLQHRRKQIQGDTADDDDVDVVKED